MTADPGRAFRGLRAMIARDLGRFPHEVDEMPFSGAVELADDWKRYPPAHVLAAVQAGVKPPRDEDDDEGGELTEEDVRELRALGGL